jgi:electron transfer flavoprotein alpha subunit
LKALVIVEHDHQLLKPNNYVLLTAAQRLDAELDVFVIGYACQTVVTTAQQLPGVRQVLVADAPEYTHQLAENVALLIAEVATGYDYIIAAASTFGKNILPRVAALLDVGMVSDVVEIITADTFVRPIYAGNALATVQTTDAKKILTIRTTAFTATKQESDHAAPFTTIDKIIPNTLTQFEKQELTQSSRPDLTSARIIISGGRGLKSADNFKILESLAECLGAALGASRAAVDAGFAPNDYQVGQTGKIVAPDLYIAVGISGAIQHLAGMKESKVIVAINNDPDAPIFQVADYGLVGDLFKILPELQTELCKSVK